MAKKVSFQCPCYQTINKANFEANLVSMAKKCPPGVHGIRQEIELLASGTEDKV